LARGNALLLQAIWWKELGTDFRRAVLGRCWDDRAPAAGALLHIRVVALGIVTIVPGRRSRLDIDLRGWSDDDRRDRIRRPVRVPVRPDGHPEGRPDEAMAAMAEVVPTMATMAAVATAMPAPRMPWY